MSIVLLPAAMDDLLSLQDYMLDRWTPELWIKAEDEIFKKLADLDSGLIQGAPVPELSAVGIRDYRTIVTSHHRVLYRLADNQTFVYAVAGHQQDFQTLLTRRLFKL
jgi:toxin ParE1/3/4